MTHARFFLGPVYHKIFKKIGTSGGFQDIEFIPHSLIYQQPCVYKCWIVSKIYTQWPYAMSQRNSITHSNNQTLQSIHL